MRLGRARLPRKIVALVALVSIFGGLIAPSSASAYTTAQIETFLPSGVDTAWAWDQTCRNNISAGRTAGGPMRSVINNGASYAGGTWLSARNQPNTVAPTQVAANSTVVPMQINSVTFLCGPLVVSNLYPGATNVPANPNAGIVADDNSRWVTNSPRNANDRAPNSSGGTNMRPALVQTRARVESLSVQGGTGTVSGGIGHVFNRDRNDSTRYWFAPKADIVYTHNTPITEPTNVTIIMGSRTVARYNGGVDQCISPGGSLVTRTGSSIAYGECRVDTDTLTLLLVPSVPPPPPPTDDPGAGSSGGCNPIQFTVSVGSDKDGPIPVSVSSSVRSFGTYSTTTTVDITSDHYTGLSYTINYQETRPYHSGWVEVYGPPASPGGDPILIRYDPVYSPARSWTSTVGPCYNYALTPIVNTVGGDGGILLNGQPPQFTATVTKADQATSKPGTRSADTFVAIKQYVVPPGTSFAETAPSYTDVFTNCDSRYSTACVTYSYTLANRVFTSASTPITDSVAAINTDDLDLGTRVCQMLAVDDSARMSATGFIERHRWSAPACFTIGKLPNIQIESGDAWTGGVSRRSANCQSFVSTNATITGNLTSFNDSRTFGSYGEYGLFALGDISTFGSANRTRADTDILTFSTTNSGNWYNPNPASECIDDAYASYRGSASGSLFGAVNLSTQLTTDGAYYASGPITLSGTLGVGRKVVIISDSNITISGSIEYDDVTYDSLRDVPSLVVATQASIRVDRGVERIDGLYQADADFATCNGADAFNADLLSSMAGKCNQQLVINGSIAAGLARQNPASPNLKGTFEFRRTFGGGRQGGVDQRDDPAERITMRPEVFLSPFSEAYGGGYIRTVGEQELPPRY